MSENPKAPNASAPDFREFANPREMFDTIADEIVARLATGVDEQGQASFVASGGTTPGTLYDLLSRRDAPWPQSSVTLSDERWVEPSSDRSNEKLVRTRLLVDKAASATLVPFKTPQPHAGEAEGEVHAALAAMPLPFDVTLLGMGSDGHTASLIPGAKGLERALDTRDPMLARAVHPPQLTEMGERITLTLRAILNSRLIVVLIKGDDKLAAYRDVMAGSDILAKPIRAVLQQSEVPVSVFWSP
jgi:6-phosphogluconolactonase